MSCHCCDTNNPVVIPCEHHGQHEWRWQPLPEHWDVPTCSRIRLQARRQMASLCPRHNDVLVWDVIKGDIYNDGTWTLLRHCESLKPGEMIIAQAQPQGV